MDRASSIEHPASACRVEAILSAVSDLLIHPLARWDGLHLVLDLVRVERHINQYLMGNDRLDDVRDVLIGAMLVIAAY